MGSGRASERRAGIKRPGPAERERTSLVRENERERQRKCRLRKKEAMAVLQEEERLYVEGEQSRSQERCNISQGRVNRRHVRRDVAAILKCVSATLANHTDGRHKEAVLQALWSNPITTAPLPLSRRMSVQAQAQEHIVCGLVQSLSEVKNAKTSAQLAAKHAILTAVVSSGASGSCRQTTRLLKVHHRNVMKAVSRRASMGSSEHILWTLSVRKRRSDATSDAVKAEVIAWWIAQTRPNPNRKDVVKKWIAPGVYEEHHSQYLLESQMEFYLRFRAAHPTVIVGKRTFDSFQPYFVRKLKDRNVCCCIYHVEMEELRVGCNFMRAKSGIHDKGACKCQCEVCESVKGEGRCSAHFSTFSGLTAMADSILCPKTDQSQWHAKDCVFGECDNCGVDFLPMCPTEEDGSSPSKVKWKQFSMESITTKKGEEKKKLTLVYKETTSAELLTYMKPKLQDFVRHSFVARWEDEQFRTCLANFPADTIVSVIDFAENYSFQVQNEVQSMHWFSYQITILVHITWVRNPMPDLDDESTRNIMQYHFYISDDMKHDSYFVQHCLMLHWDSVVEGGFTPRNHWIWSDGCAGQFKSRIPWYFVSRYPEITNGCNCMWSFFGSGHGKGPHDGAGAVLKRYIRTAQLDVNGPRLQNAETVVDFLRLKLSERPKSAYGDRRPVCRTFSHILKDDVDRETEFDCEPIKGSRDLHSVRSVGAMDVNKLLKRNLACFCVACIECNWGDCENRAWATDWEVEILVVNSPGYIRAVVNAEFKEDDWDEFGLNGEYFASITELGDNFAITAAPDNEENVEFYLLVCTKKAYSCRSAFQCPWGECFEPGDCLIQGKYYQKFGTGADTYVYLKNSQKAHIHVENIRATKFPMIIADHRVSRNDVVYRLPASVEEAIVEYAS